MPVVFWARARGKPPLTWRSIRVSLESGAFRDRLSGNHNEC